MNNATMIAPKAKVRTGQFTVAELNAIWYNALGMFMMATFA